MHGAQVALGLARLDGVDLAAKVRVRITAVVLFDYTYERARDVKMIIVAGRNSYAGLCEVGGNGCVAGTGVDTTRCEVSRGRNLGW